MACDGNAASMLGFPAETFARRRARVLDALEGGVLVLPAAPVLHRTGDTEVRYRPDSELFYLTGVTEPGGLAVVRGGNETARFTLFVSGRDEEAELWGGARLGPEEAQEVFGADETHAIDELESRLPELLDGAERVFFRLGGERSVQRQVVASLRRARLRGARRGVGPRSVVDPGVLLDDLRLLKDEHEVARIRKATDLTVGAFRSALSGLRPGMGEWELEAALEGAFRAGGGSGPAYPTIVGSGANACVLHYVDNGRRVEENDLVLLDAGAEVDLYAADVTRTCPASGSFSGPRREVYEIVAAANRAAVAAVRPGASVADVHDAAAATLTEGLVALGVLEGDPTELIAEEAHAPYFPHRTSHWLGLDVHDVGDYARNGVSRVLKPGMVLTVEPGLYFRPGSEGVREAGRQLEGIGVRVEDDVLVTEGGHENLTEALPVDAAGVEALIG